MNMENLMRALFKFAGLGESQMHEMLNNARELIVDGKRKVDDIDTSLAEVNERLKRIELQLGCGVAAPVPHLEDKTDG